MRREIRIFADTQTDNQVINSKTEAHSNPLWIVGERANTEVCSIINYVHIGPENVFSPL